MAALKHLSLMVRVGHVVHADGQDVYLWTDDEARRRRNLKNLCLPISFMYGKKNHAFLPEATRDTYDELCEVNGSCWYTWKEFEDYGHFDSFIGRDAAKDVFPWIAEQLRHPPGPARPELKAIPAQISDGS